MNEMIINRLNSHINVVESSKQLVNVINETANIIINALYTNNKILLCGNGGSAADAQHIAAEFVGRFVKERDGLPAIALTTDTSALTAIGNDYGYENVFSRQIQALASPNDVLIAISTSGNSQNIVNAINEANLIGCKTVLLTGNTGGQSSPDVKIIVPSTVTSHIQEVHILIGHILCEIVDEHFAKVGDKMDTDDLVKEGDALLKMITGPESEMPDMYELVYLTANYVRNVQNYLETNKNIL